MKIAINDKRKISAIQNDFNDMFPYLRLEFFSKPHDAGTGSPKKYMSHPSKTLGECRTKHKSGSILITPGMTVNKLEQNFREVYGLSVQVFRRSGKAWLETTVTDGWTLEEQNSQGEDLSTVKLNTRELPDESEFER